jgi:hypothetical protein
MSVIINCPCCHHLARVPRDCLGRIVKCPKCRHALTVSVVRRPPEGARAKE